MELDLSHLRQWIGRAEEAQDTVSPRLVRGLRAILDQEPGAANPGEPAPLGIHWCLAPQIVAMSALAPDGHPARGDFLPPVPLPRRMWAGGETEHLAPLKVGDSVLRRSVILEINEKKGWSGPLCFVAVSHEYETPRGLAVRERQDIVYRAAAELGRRPVMQDAKDDSDLTRTVMPTPTLLFRYSALTFNGHRIHYDRAYATEVEHYEGLVVHGPLQATLLLNLAADMRDGNAPRRFAYRGVSPLFDGTPFALCGRFTSPKDAECWSRTTDGRLAMKATAEW